MTIAQVLHSPNYQTAHYQTAHNTVVSGDVAGMWHIDPDHNPKSGEPARIWIALTKQGGTPIPLEQCDCQLQIYALPHNTQPLLTPPLQAITAEQYQNIPGTDVVFPQPGAYRLQLQGKPKGTGDFRPFSLQHTVTVAVGKPVSSASAQPTPSGMPATTTPAAAPRPQITSPISFSRLQSALALPIVMVVILGVILTAILRRQRQQK
jgi:hypothetical protein